MSIVMLHSVPTLAPPQPTFGNKYLVFTNFPNGYPLLDMTEQEAEGVLHRTNPGVPITRDQYVYGRTRWNGREVGVVVFPLQEEDSQAIDSILNDPQLQPFTKDDKVNDLMPDLIGHDQGKIFVYDRALNELVRDPDAIIRRHQFHALSDDTADDELVENLDELTSDDTPLDNDDTLVSQPDIPPSNTTLSTVVAQVPAPPVSHLPLLSSMTPTMVMASPQVQAQTNAFFVALQAQRQQASGVPSFPVLKAAHFGKQWQA
jgi:hypothetical protein